LYNRRQTFVPAHLSIGGSMRKHTILLAAVCVFLSGCAQQPAQQTPVNETAAPAASPTPSTGPVKPPTTDDEMIKSAMSAAPESVAKDATIVAMDEKMQLRTLRKGTNMWTCIPDSPSPGVDPMCVDKNGSEWLMAYVGHKKPPADKIGFGYMLMGGSDASNDDPFAAGPKEGEPWVDTGPHVMIFNIGNKFAGYPASHEDTKQPYIMWGSTPYAHLMIPVK
jgi:hypothetical protein